MPIPGYKDIIELVKTGATIEAQEEIMRLRQEAIGHQEENIRLRERVASLEARVRELERVEGEPCPRCQKRTWVVVSSKPDPTFAVVGGVRRSYKCSACGMTESILITPK